MSFKGLSESEKEELYRAVGYLEDKSHPVYSKSVCSLQIVLNCIFQMYFKKNIF